VRQFDRRQLLTLLAAGTAAALAGCTRQSGATGLLAAGPVPQPAPAPPRPNGSVRRAAQEAGPARGPATTPPGAADASPPAAQELAPPESGIAQVVVRLPAAAALAGSIALTIDDGFSPDVVAAYVEFATASGVHLTFNPNGLYAYAWEPHADVLRPLIEAGQVQIGNHTFSHKDAKRLSDHRLRQELEKNEEWVQRAFGTTTRPWWRPLWAGTGPCCGTAASGTRRSSRRRSSCTRHAPGCGLAP
jgi:peptidoglycan/xylan/chitin deacetylase (PgdA/CDA1 family)